MSNKSEQNTLKEATNNPVLICPDGKIKFNPNSYVVMIADNLEIGHERNAKLTLKKIESIDEYDPNEGYLLSNVKMMYFPKNNIINLSGKKHKVFAPKKLCGDIGIIKTKELKNYYITNDDIIFKFLNYSFIFYKFYFYRKTFDIKRCFINTPIEIIDCSIKFSSKDNGK